MSPQSIRGSWLRAQSGFGIIEIMIALALGVIIMLGVTQIATNNSDTRYELDRAGRQIENATYALREMENDLTNAGYWGEMGERQEGQVLPAATRVCPTQHCDRAVIQDLNNASCELNWALRFPVQGGTGEFACATVDPDDLDGDGDATKITPKAGTDYLAIRRTSSCAKDSAGCEAVGTNYYLQANSCYDPNDPNDPVPYGIDQAPDLDELVYKQRDCATAAPMYRLLNRIYYVNGNDQLVRADLTGTQYTQSVLAEGVEWMSLDYGVDRNGDGEVDDNVNGYTTDPTYDKATATANAFPADWANVVMVRISLVVRSAEPSGGFTDDKVYTVAGASYTVPTGFEHYRRQVYSRTVGLRNVAGRRQ
jgi:type IV pilus assembly protein PilW